jgi:hypothetical protein
LLLLEMLGWLPRGVRFAKIFCMWRLWFNARDELTCCAWVAFLEWPMGEEEEEDFFTAEDFKCAWLLEADTY